MGVSDNCRTLRGDLSGNSQAFFVYFLKKHPEHMKFFKNYKGKAPESLPSVPQFAPHVEKVVGMLLDMAERGVTAADGDKLTKMPEHTELGLQQFQDLFECLVPFLQEKLGGACDTTGWRSVGTKTVQTLKDHGMR